MSKSKGTQKKIDKAGKLSMQPVDTKPQSKINVIKEGKKENTSGNTGFTATFGLAAVNAAAAVQTTPSVNTNTTQTTAAVNAAAGSGARINGATTQLLRTQSRSASVPSGVTLSPVATNTSLEVIVKQTVAQAAVYTPSIPNIVPIYPVIAATAPETPLVQPSDLRNDWKDISDKKTSGNTFKPILDSGVGTSPFRPELIMINDYLPLYQPGVDLKFSDTGLFVDVMFQAQRLRQQTLATIIAKMQNAGELAGERFRSLAAKHDNTVAKLEKDLAVASEVQKKISELRKILDVKQIPNTQYDSKYFLSLGEFLTRKMQYSGLLQINKFSNTKILAQMLFDLRSIIENYSIDLLDLTDPDRKADYNSINIDKTYTISNGFKFNLSSLAANQKDINATNVVFVNSFLSSLPIKKQEVIKILSVLLCKELSISKGLGNQTIRNKIFGVNAANTQNNTNVFQSIIGDVGTNIFEINSTPGTLSSLLVKDVPGNPNVKILPFESKYFDAQNNRNVFVPGSSYYADSIFDIEADSPGWNTKPIIDYVSEYINVTDGATDLLSSLLGYKSPSVLFPTELIKNIYKEMNQVLSGLVNQKTFNQESAILSSIIRLSEQDNQLRNLLFQYAILAGMRMNGTTEESVAFKLLAQELQNVSALSLVRLDSRKTDDPSKVLLADGGRAFEQYIASTAVAIEKRVDQLLNNSIKRRSNTGSSSYNIETIKKKYPEFLVGVIKIDAISKSLNTALRTRSTYNFLKSFVDNFERLIVAAQENGVNNFLNNNKTNNSGLNLSTLALMFFELCASFYATYMGSTIQQAEKNTVLTVDVKKNNSIRLALSDLERKVIPVPTYNDIIATAENLQSSSRINSKMTFSSAPDADQLTQETKQTELYNILIELSEEQNIPANILYILQTIKSYIRNNSTATLTFFQQNNLQNYLVDNNINSDKLEVLQNPSQLRVSAHILDVIKSSKPTNIKYTTYSGQREVDALTNKLILTDILTPNEYSLIKAMMSENPYKPEASNSPEKQIKIFSIGIPVGYSKQLVDRINVEDIGNRDLFSRQSDIVDVLIYKRDLRFEDIVFKPLKFSFDMSLFVDQESIDSLAVNERSSFDTIYKKLLLADYPFDAENGYRKKLLRPTEILEYRRTLNINELQILYKNHVVSYILDMYISLLTGLKVDETTFIQTQSKPQRSLDKELFEAVYRYIQFTSQATLPDLPSLQNDAQVLALIKQILNSPAYTDRTKDYLRLFTYGTIAFNTEYVTALVNQPKIFDRVFHVPVDVFNFEIDIEKTNSTESGKQALNSTYVQERIEGNRFKPKSATEIIFEDFFVRIETAIDKD